MSVWDSVLSNTVGVIYSAASGNVDPWTAANDRADQVAAAVQALGPGASDAAKLDTARQVTSMYDSQLTAAGANPDNKCLLSLPIIGCVIGGPGALQNLKKIVDRTIFVLAAGSVVYFTVKYRQSIKRGLVAAKKDLKL